MILNYSICLKSNSMMTHVTISKFVRVVQQNLYGCSHVICKTDSILVAVEQYQNLAQLVLLKSHFGALYTEEHFCDSCDFSFQKSDAFCISFDFPGNLLNKSSLI